MLGKLQGRADGTTDWINSACNTYPTVSLLRSTTAVEASDDKQDPWIGCLVSPEALTLVLMPKSCPMEYRPCGLPLLTISVWRDVNSEKGVG